MPPDQSQIPNEPPSEGILGRQRDANQTLVLAGLRAQEEADDARTAMLRSEDETRQGLAREEVLRTTAEFRERLIAIIGHDLRNPLNTIVMASAYQIAHGNLAGENKRMTHRVATSAARMTRMLTQLVGFTRARLGGAFDLNRVMTHVGDVCRDIAEEFRITSSVKVDVAVDGNVVSLCDPDQLGEVISNLAGDAVEHAEHGTPVTVYARGEELDVVVHVTNQGHPIADDLLPHLFSPFRRATTSANAATVGHLGLGLYIAHEIVVAHGGTLAVQSGNGRTTFTVRLPRSLPSTQRH